MRVRQTQSLPEHKRQQRPYHHQHEHHGELGLTGAINVPTPKTELKANQSATWCVVLAREPGRLDGLIKKGWLPLGPGDGLKDVTPWTDDYINIMLPLRDGIQERWDGFHFSSWMKSIWP